MGRILNSRQCGELMGISRIHVWRLWRYAGLPAGRWGKRGCLRFNSTEVINWMKRRGYGTHGRAVDKHAPQAQVDHAKSAAEVRRRQVLENRSWALGEQV